MQESELLALINEMKASRDLQVAGRDMVFRSLVMPRLTWDHAALEERYAIELPGDLRIIWTKTCNVVMFWDITFGQWGLVLWSPDQVLARQERYRDQRRDEEWRPGDLIIGEFLGDSDLLVLRCDPASADFGSVVVSVPIDPRAYWWSPATSLGEFLHKFWIAKGEKFWTRRA